MQSTKTKPVKQKERQKDKQSDNETVRYKEKDGQLVRYKDSRTDGTKNRSTGISDSLRFLQVANQRKCRHH